MIKGLMLFKWLRRLRNLLGLTHKPQLKFSSSFIQYWYCKDWDSERWLEEYRILKKVGINEIILQYVADTKNKFAVYKTKIEGYTNNDIDMLETALNAANIVRMKVRIGLGLNDDWFTSKAQDVEWLNNEAEANSKIATELINLYGKNRALAGWYIPHEFNPLMALNPIQQFSFNHFYKKIAYTVKAKSRKNIMVAPFYNAIVSGPVTLSLWCELVKNTFNKTGIDIIALQDSIGADFNRLWDLDEVFAYTKKATDKIHITLYAVTETFEKTFKGNVPAPINRVIKQMSIVGPYVSKFVAFSIDHYQNPMETTQVTGYEDYHQYYLSL